MNSLTTNHDYEHRAHESHMATEKAPGPPLLPRRRVRVTILHYLFATLAAVVAVVMAMFVLMLVGFLLTGSIPRFF